jgi:hypothetical protein
MQGRVFEKMYGCLKFRKALRSRLTAEKIVLSSSFGRFREMGAVRRAPLQPVRAVDPLLAVANPETAPERKTNKKTFLC